MPWWCLGVEFLPSAGPSCAGASCQREFWRSWHVTDPTQMRGTSDRPVMELGEECFQPLCLKLKLNIQKQGENITVASSRDIEKHRELLCSRESSKVHWHCGSLTVADGNCQMAMRPTWLDRRPLASKNEMQSCVRLAGTELPRNSHQTALFEMCLASIASARGKIRSFHLSAAVCELLQVATFPRELLGCMVQVRFALQHVQQRFVLLCRMTLLIRGLAMRLNASSQNLAGCQKV